MSDDDSRKLTEDTVPGEPQDEPSADEGYTRSVTVVHPFTAIQARSVRQRQRTAQGPPKRQDYWCKGALILRLSVLTDR